MDLKTFDVHLKAIVPVGSRPLLCEGSPLDCFILLVGLNPRTSTPFWNYWDASYGCHKSRWLKEYLRLHGSLGRTREKMEIIWAALEPFRCLETNLFAAPSKRLKDLPSERRCKEVFDLLLEAIKPRLIFVHGRLAISEVERRTGRDLLLNAFHQARLDGQETWIYPRHHLSYQLSNSDCRELGIKLREHVIKIGIPCSPRTTP